MSEVNLTATFSEPSADIVLTATINSVSAESVIYNEELKQYIENIKNEVSESVTNVTDKLSVDVTGRLGYRFTVNTQAGVSYTPVLADEGSLIRMTNSLANEFVLPADQVVPFEVGTILNLRQSGLGKTTIVPQAGVTVNTPDQSLEVDSQNLGLGLVKVGPDEWDVVKSFVGVPLGEVESFAADVDSSITLMEEAQASLEQTVTSTTETLNQTVTDLETDLNLKIANALKKAEAAVDDLTSVPTLDQFDALQEDTGYQKLPGGLVMQWGRYKPGSSSNGSSFSVPFTTPFPTKCIHASISGTAGITGDGQYDEGMAISAISTTGISVYRGWKYWPLSGLKGYVLWFAIGY